MQRDILEYIYMKNVYLQGDIKLHTAEIYLRTFFGFM